MGNEFASQASLAVVVSFAMQWLKKSPWFPWISVKTENLNRGISMAIAFLSGFGIFFTWDHAASALTISGLTAAHLYHAAARGVEQWIFQQTAYRTVVAPPLPGAVQAEQGPQQKAGGSKWQA